MGEQQFKTEFYIKFIHKKCVGEIFFKTEKDMLEFKEDGEQMLYVWEQMLHPKQENRTDIINELFESDYDICCISLEAVEE